MNKNLSERDVFGINPETTSKSRCDSFTFKSHVGLGWKSCADHQMELDVFEPRSSDERDWVELGLFVL